MTTLFQILPALTKKTRLETQTCLVVLYVISELINSTLLKHQVEFPAEKLL